MPVNHDRQNKTGFHLKSNNMGLAKRISAVLLLIALFSVLFSCAGSNKTGTPADENGARNEAGTADSNVGNGSSDKEILDNDEPDSAGRTDNDLPGDKEELAEEKEKLTEEKEQLTEENGEPSEENGELTEENEQNDDKEGAECNSEPEIVLYINEILPTNNSCIKHNGGYYDAVEIINASECSVNLSAYCLSDSRIHRTDYSLPAVEIQPGELAVFYCTGKYAQKTECDLPFELSYFGEKLYLSDRDGNILDKVEYPELPANVSYSREESGDFTICTKPTIGNNNRTGYRTMSSKPCVQPSPGFYSEPQKLVFTSAGEIHYTLDGSSPTMNSPIWNGSELSIDRTCTVRAFTHTEDGLDSFIGSFNYYIQEPEYELDVLSVSMKPDDFDLMSENYKSNRKYSANVTLFINRRQQFSTDCGISMFGCTSRAYDKKSYQLSFSTAFGPSKLKYRVFDNLDITEFNSLVLRSGSQDNGATMLRDEYVSSLAVSNGVITNVLVQAYRPVNLYVNGEYRGIYFIREHIDENMIASHYGCDPEQVTLIEQTDEVKSGSEGREWRQLWNFVRDNRLTDSSNYEYVKNLVDLESVADYYIIQMWCSNHDLDNVREFKTPDGKWRYILYDLDLTLSSTEEGSVKYTLGKFSTGLYSFNALVYRLLENDEFLMLFLDRLDILTSTVFSTDYAIRHLEHMAEILNHDMEYNCKLWAGEDSSGLIYYRNYSGWEQSVEYLKNMLEGRCEVLTEEFCLLEGIDISDEDEEAGEGDETP